MRRRRWVRKCQIQTSALWKEARQTHKITSLAFDQELNNDQILLFATDSNGYMLNALIDVSAMALSAAAGGDRIKWRHISSMEKFEWVSIGLNLKVWAVDVEGNVYYRDGVDARSDYCGRDWTQVRVSDFDRMFSKIDLRFRMVSVGNECVWAISKTEDLYFRENVSKMLPQGTSWCRVDKRIKYVSVNGKNEVNIKIILVWGIFILF